MQPVRFPADASPQPPLGWTHWVALTGLNSLGRHRHAQADGLAGSQSCWLWSSTLFYDLPQLSGPLLFHFRYQQNPNVFLSSLYGLGCFYGLSVRCFNFPCYELWKLSCWSCNDFCVDEATNTISTGYDCLSHVIQACRYVIIPKNKSNFCLHQVIEPKSCVVIEKSPNLHLAQAINQNKVWELLPTTGRWVGVRYLLIVPAGCVWTQWKWGRSDGWLFGCVQEILTGIGSSAASQRFMQCSVLGPSRVWTGCAALSGQRTKGCLSPPAELKKLNLRADRTEELFPWHSALHAKLSDRNRTC